MSRNETTTNPPDDASLAQATAPLRSLPRQETASTSAADLRDSLVAEIDGEVRFDTVSRGLYATDASVYQIIPAGVVIPRVPQDVIRTVNHCRRHGISITARGGGTSQAGQAVGAGVQLDFSKYMNRMLELNPDEPSVRVQPGIVLDELNALLKPYGLHLPLDLSTSNRATIGGMIANNSSGTRSVIYGKTIDFVLEMTVVLADGSVVKMHELDNCQLEAKCGQTNLEGECYRAVRQLAARHGEEIGRRYPKILRRVGGYNLDEFVASDKPFNLARLLVGSEGTLGLILDAKLRLSPLPKSRILLAVQFHDLLESLAATPHILAHHPSAVELVDRFILTSTVGKTEFEPLRDFIDGDPAAVLLVEFFGDTPNELSARAKQLEQDLRERDCGYHFHHATSDDAQARIWGLRRAALGLSMSQTGDAKSISFVEDTAVAPERLRDYIERFRDILAEHDTQAGFYAHASVGLLHIRPVIDMKSAAGVEIFRQVAEKISDLVLEFGGALSGEHGDGLARSPFQRKMYGPNLYEAFCELKRTFDAKGLLNPGKIVHAPPITENLRFGAQYETRHVDTFFDFSDFGGLARAAEQCGGVGACRKTLGGTMCPSYMVTRDEADSTRGRANALRMAIAGQLDSVGLADAQLYPVLELCLECKACKSECPTGVDLARLKSEFLYQYHRRFGMPIRSRLLARADRIAQWGSRLAPLSTWLVQRELSRWLTEIVFGLDRRRVPPQFARQTFIDWWTTNSRWVMQDSGRETDRTSSPWELGDGPTGPSRSVAIFADTFTNYHEPEHGIAAVRLAESLGIDVTVPPRVCCGRPLISKGLLDEARRQAEATTHILTLLARRNVPIMFCEPSCYSAVVDDHPHLVRRELSGQAQTVAAACITFDEWALSVLDSASLKRGPTELLLHGHCHQKSLVGMGPTVKLLSMIPDCKVIEIDSGCCGMAGSFGYEREHYEVSRLIGEHKLLPVVRQQGPDAIVVAPGFSCRHQVQHFTGVQPVSPATLLEPLLNVAKRT